MENKLEIINFTAPWCGACQMFKPIINQLQEEFKDDTRISIQRIDVSENEELAKTYNVRSLPTTLFLLNSVEMEKVIGATNKKNILEKINIFL
jgi:thioredoxin 1